MLLYFFINLHSNARSEVRISDSFFLEIHVKIVLAVLKMLTFSQTLTFSVSPNLATERNRRAAIYLFKASVLALFILQLECPRAPSHHVQLSATHRLWPTRFLYSWDFSGKNTGVGSPFPSPGDLANPGIEPSSLAAPAWQAASLPLSHLGSP